MKNKFRRANVGVAVGAVLLATNLILFHGNDRAMSAGGLVAFVVAMGIFLFLDERDYRARHSVDRDSD